MFLAPLQRDENGKLTRSRWAKKEFMKQSGYPHGRPGYQIDHVTPLKYGGLDHPLNMQWLTPEEHKEKHR